MLRAVTRRGDQAPEIPSHRAAFALTELVELHKSLRREVQGELRDLLRFWDFDTAIRDSVARKVSASERRLDEMSETRAPGEATSSPT